MIYLDYNATTPLLPEVVDAMIPYLREHFGNPSSGHLFGKKAKDAVEQARAQVAKILGAQEDEIFFTSGGTEANNLAIRGIVDSQAASSPSNPKKKIITSNIEHPATSNPCKWLERQGFEIVRAPVDALGRVQVSHIEAALSSKVALVTVMHSNNETGSLQPIREISALAQQHGCVVHTDAAQSVGKVGLDVNELGVDLLSVAGHKLYAPKGVGALFVKRGTKISPFTLGAGHERGLRPGTENVASIVGLGVACEVARKSLEESASKVRSLRDHLWELLRAKIDGIALNGHPTKRLPNTLNVRFPRVSGTAILAATPDIAASTGSACHDGHESASAVILAMGIPEKEAVGSVRLTLGRHTSKQEIERAAESLASAYQALCITH
jgi:cysteine desulfurase